MPLFTVLFYFFSAIGVLLIALSILGWLIWVIEFIQDKIEEWKRR